MGWIGVDLDGTLAQYPPENGKTIGDVISPMAQRIINWNKDGVEVRIFTVRATTAAGRKQVKTWLKTNQLPDLVVTATKDSGLLELWDDRAIRVIKNTGVLCSGCSASTHYSINSWHATNC